MDDVGISEPILLVNGTSNYGWIQLNKGGRYQLFTVSLPSGVRAIRYGPSKSEYVDTDITQNPQLIWLGRGYWVSIRLLGTPTAATRVYLTTAF